MKLTLDRMCIQTGNLCNTCSSRLESGEIGEIDIKVGKTFINIAKSQKFLANITIYSIVETDDAVYVIVNGADKEKILTALDFVLQQLATIDNRDYVFIGKTKNAKKLMEDVLGSDFIVGTSTVFLPPFSDKELKVQVKKENKDHLKVPAEQLSILTTQLLGMNAHYAFV